MTTKAKLVIFELVAGIFGWGWLVAVGFAVYYLVMAVGFGGGWTPFFVAVGASAISKWLARGFDDNKRRAAVEANLIAKGASHEETGRAWLEAYTGQAVHRNNGELTMAYYNLLVVNENRTLATAARDREDALAIFGKELDLRLTLNDPDIPAPYLLDEWHESPHWVNPTIPVFELSN